MSTSPNTIMRLYQQDFVDELHSAPDPAAHEQAVSDIARLDGEMTEARRMLEWLLEVTVLRAWQDNGHESIRTPWRSRGATTPAHDRPPPSPQARRWSIL